MGAMDSATRPLGATDRPALDRLLAEAGLPAAYARDHLRVHGLQAAGARAVGTPGAGDAAVAAALVADEGIAWAFWRTPAQAAALGTALPDLGSNLLSGPRDLVAPLLAHLPPRGVGGVDRCPFERLAPADLSLPPAPHTPAPRRATPADMEPLIDFYIRGFYSLAQLPTRAAWRTRLQEQLESRTLFLIEHDGIVVSAAQSSAEAGDVAMIGGVATVPAYRNRGFSARCVAALCSALFAGGVREIGLFYLPANLPAARVYRKLGFRPAGEWWLQRLTYW